MVTKGNMLGGRIKWEVASGKCTLLYTKFVSDKDLLYSTGKSTQPSVITYMGKKMDLCLGITDSLCGTPETNTTLLSPLTPIKF